MAPRKKKVRGKRKGPSWAAGKTRWVEPERGFKAQRKLFYLQPTRAIVASSNYRTGGFVGIERKFLDCAWNGVAIASSTAGADGEMQPSSGCTGCISAPVQGNGEQERDGRRYNIKSISVSGVVDTTAVQNQTDVLDLFGYFFALVQDKQTNASTIVSEDVYVNPSANSTAMLPFPLRNLQNTRRFRILDSVYIRPGDAWVMGDGTNTGSLSNQVAPTFKLSWSGNIPVDSVGTTADVASVSNNSVHLIAFAGSTVFTPIISAKSRVRFIG